MKTLVAGWFSFPQMGATAGDLLTRDLVCRWLEEAGRAYDVAVAPPFAGGVQWSAADPDDYSDLVFVCGPFGNGWPIPEFLDRFAGRRIIGVNLSMLKPFDAALGKAFDWALTEDARIEARDCRMRAAAELRDVKDRFLSAFTGGDNVVDASGRVRT